jgi:hypothetical protein
VTLVIVFRTSWLADEKDFIHIELIGIMLHL